MVHRLVRLLGLAAGVFSCAPAVSVHVPPRPKESADSAGCAQAGKLRDQAAQVRSAGRRLRARLFEERAHALCGVLPTPVPEGNPQGAYQRLEEVWSWLARNGPRQALDPNRLSDAKMAAALIDLLGGWAILYAPLETHAHSHYN
jgi:hypothetical protein